VQWSDEGIEASYKFIQKLWGLHRNIVNEIQFDRKTDLDENLERVTDQFINNVEKNLENFRYNKIVANLHEIYSSYNKINFKNYSSKNIKENYSKILITMLPIIPHFSNECLKILDVDKNVEWPKINFNNLSDDKTKYVIQINGKTRQIIEQKKDLNKEELILLIKKDQKLSKYIQENSKIKKSIFVHNKLINIII